MEMQAQNGTTERNLRMASMEASEDPDQKNCSILVTNFGQSTTCHGLQQILIGDSPFRKLIWLAVFLTAMGVFTFQAYELVSLFLTYDVRINMEVGTASSLPFPAVTICNTNKLRLSEIERSVHHELTKTDPEHPDSIHRQLSYETPCLQGDHECRDGVRCIKPHLKCDGYFHCWDGYSDEVGCSYPPCGSEEFNCGQAGFHGICISNEKRCDGVRDCFDGRDEMNCTVCYGGRQCDVGLDSHASKCIPEDNICDRFPDCIDGADEESCVLTDQCEMGVLFARSDPSVLYSRNYPKKYDTDYTCELRLTAETGFDGLQSSDCISLAFLELDIERGKNCQRDYIEIRDYYNPTITRKYCGSRIPPSWTSSSRDVIIKFVSNGKKTGKGYRIQYSLATCPPSKKWAVSPWTECSKTCGGGVRKRNVTCSVIESDDPSMDFADMSLDSGENFDNPLVEGSNGKMVVARGTRGHYDSPDTGDYFADEGDVSRRCTSAGSSPERVESCNNTPCSGDTICGQLFDSCCTEITSPGFPNGYASDLDCEVTIVNYGGCIVLTIEEIDLVNSENCHKDYLEYRDLLSDERVPERLCGRDEGVQYFSASSSLRLTFHSDSILTGKGFNASYEFVQCGSWHMSPWRGCTFACEYGQSVRQVQCVSRNSNRPIEDTFCQGDRPASVKPCERQMCGKRPGGIQILDKLFEKYGHISDDKKLYENFELNYYKSNNFDRVQTFPDPNWKGFLAYSTSPDYSDLQKVLHLDRDEVARFGHQAEDFILQCSFDEVYCDHRFENDVYGNCFTFNSLQQNNQTTVTSSRPGSRYGLKLTLFIEQDEYIPLYGQEAGVRVLIHPQDITPFPEDEAITVAPGLKTSIGIRMDTIKSLSEPYTNCSNDEDFESVYGEGYKYSDMDCHKTTMQQYIRDECECVDTIYLEGIPCDVADFKQEQCRQLMEYFYQRGLISNNCKEPCKATKYSKTMSQSMWPSKKHVGGVIKVLRPINEKVRNIVVDEQSARENLVRLAVYYEELNYQKITKLPAYTIEELLADLGGILGLYIGMSLITAFEVLELFLNALRHLAKKFCKPKPEEDGPTYL
ncbi:uncharacterized protein [Ptychodera flava]|uniref:uncharacterized protein isoform X2 n=1 Tax=Ptychodera flava TaxID=63121 RepID=UPI00396A439C